VLDWEYVLKFGGNIKFTKFTQIQAKLVAAVDLLGKRLRNRTPEKLIDFSKRFIAPYLALFLIVAFVFTAGLVHAAEDFPSAPNDEVLDLAPAEVAKTVTAIGPYTPVFEEDAVNVALAMKNEDYLGKPVITETQKTEVPAENRKTNITYTVEGGDTISSIGWKYGLKISTIKALNGLSSDNIKPGQTLKLPPADLSAAQLAKLSVPKSSAGARTPFSGTFGRPVGGWFISQVFGHTSFESNHTGVDFDSRSGRNIYASASGTISKIGRGWGGGYGNHIMINHGGGFSTLYGHLSQINVSNGQWVNKGQVIGIMGSTGWSTGPHLHFEIRVNGRTVNPLQYL